ncbi:MAG: TonB-dependent receptor plug domain-containing protein [Chitinophagaceae bacterium]|nr:TonB-dependent receptor plug domain-containing protein [Chitinophagaceae bacterium]
MKRKISMMAALLFSSHLFAQQDSSRMLNEVVVTSNKFERKQAETGKVVTVIGRDQLDRSTGRSIGDVLNTAVGTTVIGSNNAPGTNLTASVRGASAGNTLILLDGIPVSDPSVNNNYFDLNLIPIDQIERIEILKGGQSTLYGSDAVAGVINIITRKATTSGIKLNATLAAGTYGTFKQDLGVTGKKGKLNYSVGYTHLNAKGFSAATDETGGNNFDKDGIDQHAAQLQLGYQLTSAIKLQLMGRF